MGNNENWQNVLNEFSDGSAAPRQPQQPQQTQSQFQQAQYTQPQQAQYTQLQQAQFTQPQQTQFTQPQQAQYTQPQQIQYAQPQMASASGMAVMSAPKAKSKVMPVLIVVIVAAVVAGLVFLLFQLFGSKGGYEGLERKYFSDMGNAISSVTSGQIGSESTISFKFGNELLSQMGIYEITELAPTELQMTQFSDMEKGLSSATCLLKSGENEYCTVNVWVDNQKLYMQIPDLSDKYIVMDMSSMSQMLQSASTGDLDAFLSDTSDVTVAPMMDIDTGTGTIYPSSSDMSELMEMFGEETVQKLADIIVDAYFKNFKAVENGSDTFTTDYISVPCTSYTISMDMETTMNFLKDVIRSMENDADIMKIMETMGLNSATIAYLEKSIDFSLARLSEAEKTMELVKMVVYAKDDSIIGRVITIGGGTLGESVEIVIAQAADNTKFDYSVSMTADGETIEMGIAGTVNGKTYTGDIFVRGMGETILSGNASFDCETYNGTYFVQFNAEETTASFEFTVSGDEKNKTVECKVAIDGAEVCTFSVAAKEIPYQQVTVPTVDSSNSIDPTTASESELEAFVADMEQGAQNILDKINNAAGSPDLIYLLVKQMSSATVAIS